MAKTPNLRNLNPAEFSGPTGLTSFLGVFNNIVDDLRGALVNGLTFQDNSLATLKIIAFTVPAGGFVPFTFLSGLKVAARGVLLASLQVTGSGVGTAAPVGWSENTLGTIQIDSITGLSAGAAYTATFLVF